MLYKVVAEVNPQQTAFVLESLYPARQGDFRCIALEAGVFHACVRSMLI